jgi:hypothetical protein
VKVLFHLLCSCSIATAGFALDVSNLDNCTEDVKKNLALPNTEMDFFPLDYDQLMAALAKPEVRHAFPALYQHSMFDPFVAFLKGMGKNGFNTIFLGGGGMNPQAPFFQEVIPDVGEAILQIGENYSPGATNAFEEVVSDLFDGFLSDESRRSNQTGVPIKLPDYGVIAPLVKWGKPQNGPYTWPVDATRLLRLGAGVVSLPPSHRLGGLLAWTALPHETAGHDVLHADAGLLNEFSNKIFAALLAQLPNYPMLANYWAQCTDEAMSDVCGLLNGGPTIGLGLVGYFRGLLGGKLRNVAPLPPADTHPCDIFRGFMAAHIVEKMPFPGAQDWANAIRQEVYKDLTMVYLLDTQTGSQYPVPNQIARQASEIVADMAFTKMATLENNALADIQIWGAQDQATAERIGALLVQGGPVPDDFRNSGYYAAHVVAAAAMEAFKAGADIPTLFHHMVRWLDVMHRNNNAWNNVLPPQPTQGDLLAPRHATH